MTRTDRYWAAIARDHAQGEVDAVTRLADEEVAVVQARLDDAEARVDALTDELALTRDTLARRSAAHDRLCATVDRVRALFSGGPDTPCRTWWRGDIGEGTQIECVEVPLADLDAALADPEVTP